MTDTATGLDGGQAVGELQINRLNEFLRPLLDLAGPLNATLLTGGRSNPTYIIDDGIRSWVLRRPPFGLVLETAHDMAREYRVISALSGSSVPVPQPIVLCEDPSVIGAPFYVMERIDGIAIGSREDAEALSPTERRDLAATFVRTFAALHSVDPAAVGLAGWGRPDGYLERQIRRWGKQWEQAHSRPRSSVDETLRLLARHLPPTRFTGIVHGDVKLDNLMVNRSRPGQALGLLDWEMSTLGDTLADVGLLWTFWDDSKRPYNPLTRGITDLPGFPTADEMVQLYAAERGIEVGDVMWYAALADLKIGIILEQIHVRSLSGQTVEGIDNVGAMVDPLLERALQTVRSVVPKG
ncbi:phosphotransferase family protein [Arthrobacter sp. BHU FT2]|nr:phosphotransferase family protein [Arthrobacter sp. BHU FT2]